jgi:hypothetical protein
MSHSEVHIFWWNCDNMECDSTAHVIGEGMPAGWWRIEANLRGRVTYDRKSLAFCSEACATKIRDDLLRPMQGYLDDRALDASVLLDSLRG